MPVTVDDFLRENMATAASSSSVVVTHPDAGGTTEGMTVVIVLGAATTSVTMPAGFISLGSVGNTVWIYAKSNVAAGETSWTFTLGAATTQAWYMAEVDGVVLLDPADGISSSSGALGNGGTRSTGSVANAGSSGLALAVYYANKEGTGDVQSWSGWTNSFEERVEIAPAPGTAGRQLAIAVRTYDSFSTWETTATFATTAGTPTTAAVLVLLRSADASINAPLNYLTGFEYGTHAGFDSSIGTPNGGSAFGTWGTNYLVQAGSARNGGYGLRVTSSASVAYLQLPVISSNTFAFGCNVKAVSATGTPVAVFLNTNQSDLSLVYDPSTEKFGLRWNVATVSWQTGTTPLGTWAWVDIRATLNSSVHHAEWSIETGTGDGSQTSPADITGATVASASTNVYLGHANSQTGSFDYDDVVYSRYAGAYPLGPHVIRLLVPETTGATVSGDSTNFRRFTANGTLANVDGTEGALLDEVPPTVSASSDGVVQVATAASDYLNLPMTTYTLASDEIIAGVRFVASLWGGAGSGTGTLGWRGYDGTSETTLVAAGTVYDAASPTAISATEPGWNAVMWPGGASGAWTQDRLNNAAVRMGFSTDATPDMGASAAYLEVAIVKARYFVKYRLVDGEDPADFQAAVYEYINPYNSGTRSFGVDNQDATRSCIFTWTDSGGPHSVTVNPSDPIEIVTIDEDAVGNVTDTSFAWVA